MATQNNYSLSEESLFSQFEHYVPRLVLFVLKSVVSQLLIHCLQTDKHLRGQSDIPLRQE